MKAHRFRAELTADQQRWAARAAGTNRWVFNEARKYCHEEHKKGNKYPGFAGLCKKLTEWRTQYLWLKEGNAQAQQQAIADFDNSMQRFFKKLGGRPKKKTRKKSTPSMRFPQGSKMETKKLSRGDSEIHLPKIGDVRFRQSQEIEGNIRQTTLKRDRLYNWDIVILTDAVAPAVDKDARRHLPDVGIDMGVARTATLSDGRFFSVPTPTKKEEAHHRKLKRRLSRREKGSKRRERARLAVAKVEQKWSNRRKDVLHKESTRITRENQAVYVEDLKVNNMTKRVRGKERAAKAGLNKAILQQGWGMFHGMLSYKKARLGEVFGKSNPAFTSQTCSQPGCGHCETGNRPSQAVFHCLKCGHTENADTNASKNILAEGRSATARGRSLRPVTTGTSVRAKLAGRLKREPTGVSVA